MKKLRLGLDKPALLRKLGDLGQGLATERRAEVVAELEQLRSVLGQIARTIRGGR